MANSNKDIAISRAQAAILTAIKLHKDHPYLASLLHLLTERCTTIKSIDQPSMQEIFNSDFLQTIKDKKERTPIRIIEHYLSEFSPDIDCQHPWETTDSTSPFRFFKTPRPEKQTLIPAPVDNNRIGG